MKYYLPTFEDIDHLREEYVDEFLAARRMNSMFSRANDSMGSFCAQSNYDVIEDDDEMRY